MSLIVENIEVLKKALQENAYLFLGAGFSIDSSNSDNLKLPTGEGLAKELKEIYSMQEFSWKSLDMICQELKIKDEASFNSFIRKRFTVAEFDPYYLSLLKLRIKKIFTTNVDDLIPKIYSNNQGVYLHNAILEGEANTPNSIQYFPLHGCVNDTESTLVFGQSEISNAVNKNNGWTHLGLNTRNANIFILGYSVSDTGFFQTFFPNNLKLNGNNYKWLLLYNPEPGVKEYFENLGFTCIIGSVKSFLSFVEKEINVNYGSNKNVVTEKSLYQDELKKFIVPRSIKEIPRGKIESFYNGDYPSFSTIVDPSVIKISHYDRILNCILGKSNVIVVGSIGSGKSTLLHQLAFYLPEKNKFIFTRVQISLQYAKFLEVVIRDVVKQGIVYIFFDDVANSIDAFQYFSSLADFIVIGFERDYNYELSQHKLNSSFELISVTAIEESDKNAIKKSFPLSILRNDQHNSNNSNWKPKSELSLSLFSYICQISKVNPESRINSVISQLKSYDIENNTVIYDLLLLMSYLHTCRVPVSVKLVLAFFNYDWAKDYEFVKEMIYSLKSFFIKEDLSGFVFEDSSEENDLIFPTSLFFSENLLKTADSKDIGNVLINFQLNVPDYLIIGYQTFKWRAYDANLTFKAFPHSSNADHYYSLVLKDEYNRNNPFIYQQFALYYFRKKDYTNAMDKILIAKKLQYRPIYSIENTFHLILFQQNLDVLNSEGGDALTNIQDAIKGFEHCLKNDVKRKTYHLKVYTDCALNFAKKVSKFNNTRIDSLMYVSRLSEILNSIHANTEFDKNEISRLKWILQRKLSQ